MIDKEETKFLQEIKEKVDHLIDKLCSKYNYDRAYFKFRLTCSLYNGSFSKIDEVELFNDDKPQYCEFCHKETYFYYEDQDIFLCAECYGKLGGKNEKQIWIGKIFIGDLAKEYAEIKYTETYKTKGGKIK
jgi:hypothetical protein